MLNGVNVMFNKKILFLITLIFMLSVSAVAAVETNSSDDLTVSDVEDEPPSNSIEVISNEELSSSNEDSISQEVSSGNSDNASDVLSATNDDNVSDDVLSVNNGDVNEILSATPVYSISGKDVKMYYKDGSGYEVTLLKDSKPLSGKTVAIKINGATYKRVTDSRGKASIQLNINTGFYIISAYCCGVETTNKVNVLVPITAKDLAASYKSNAAFSAKFIGKSVPLNNAAVSFIVDGKKRSAKTNSNGVASFSVSDLSLGTHSVYSVHPTGYKVLNKINIHPSVVSEEFSKHYKSSKSLPATFYDKSNKLLANHNVNFIINGKTYTKKTNANGVAYMGIGLNPGTYKVNIVNPVTGEKVTNTVKVFRTIYFTKTSYAPSGQTSSFKVTLYKNENLIKDQNVEIHLNGKTFTIKTNDKGVATLKYKLAKGSHALKVVDPYTGCSGAAKIIVCSQTILASDMYTRQGISSRYYVDLLDFDGERASHAKVQIKIDDKTYTTSTNVYGTASVPINLKYGDHTVVIKDLTTGFTKTTKIHTLKDSKGMRYNKYGVSSDGYTILAIGRPSGIGEEYAYGYTFYQREFIRECPYCGGHNIYWSIFWAGNEYTDVGVFPATGNHEGSSAEGGIFCADCDCDWSIFGQNRGDSGGDLTPVSDPIHSTKADAYTLKSGNYVHP